MNEYFNDPALSQSKIKKLLKGLGSYHSKDLYFEEKESLLYGSAVDCWLTEGEDVFWNTYYISTINKPSDKIMSIIHWIVDNYGELSDVAILNGCMYHNYQNRWTDDVKIQKITDLGKEYFDELIASKDKTIIDTQQWWIIQALILSFYLDTKCNILFVEEFGKRKLYQLPIYFRYEHVDCKALLDILVIDDMAKTVQIFDIKTTAFPTKDFKKVAKKFRYDIQASFYTLAIQKWLEDRGMVDYAILPFTFVVESVQYPDKPVFYVCNDTDLYTGKYGLIETQQCITDKFKDKHIEHYGYEEGIVRYKYYMENNQYEEYILAINDYILPFNLWDLDDSIQI